MAKKFESRSDVWRSENRFQEDNVYPKLKALEKINSKIQKGLALVSSDKYGNMRSYSAHSFIPEINSALGKRTILSIYARGIHRQIEEIDFNFYKAVNKHQEILTILDINEIEIKNTLGIEATGELPDYDADGNMTGTYSKYKYKKIR